VFRPNNSSSAVPLPFATVTSLLEVLVRMGGGGVFTAVALLVVLAFAETVTSAVETEHVEVCMTMTLLCYDIQ